MLFTNNLQCSRGKMQLHQPLDTSYHVESSTFGVALRFYDSEHL